jgi:uncharacterized damage-inducible protein DinB
MMKYYGAKELAESYRTVRKNTIAVATDIPEDQYGFRPANGSRSVAESLVHIATSNRFQHKLHAVDRRNTFVGIDFASVMREFQAEEKRQRTKGEIIELLRANGETFAAWLEGLSEEFLGEQISMMPGQTPASKSRFELLLATKEHEMHHRAQLMLVERLLGIVPHLTREREARIAAAQAAPAKA